MPIFDDFVSVDSTPLFKKATGTAKAGYLLWGDGVKVVQSGVSRTKVRARGRYRYGWVANSALGGQSLLELYFVDVGQGDGILIKTPNFRHLMIDGGYPRSQQDTGKNAADFVDWKFYEDYARNRIDLDAMITSHCDADHYGGLMDLLDVAQSNELDANGVRVDAFYHAGLSWWAKPGGKTLGPWTDTRSGKFWTRLLEDRASAWKATGHGTGPQLKGWWKDFFDLVLQAQTRGGQSTPIARLSHADTFVPGFDDGTPGEPSIRVLGPVEFMTGGNPALRKFSGGNSKNTNGVSLLLRIDFGRSRILLTGDLNQVSQHTLLADYSGQSLEFACDVAKACHHGSEDISYNFLQAMQPAATIISSGDNEGHDHPRPSIVAASATTGYLQLDQQNDKLLTPLIYSTELARSIDLGDPHKLVQANSQTLSGNTFKQSTLHIKKAHYKTRKIEHLKVVGGLIYGLVNVRTDGERILCATMDEQSARWRVESFMSRF